MNTLSIIVPVYNGAPGIRDSLLALCGYLERRGEGELVVVDDGSSDGTAELLADFAASQARQLVDFKRLTNPTNRGKGNAVRRGLLAARGALRVFTDADLAYPIENLPALEACLISGADIAIANRIHPESRYVLEPSRLEGFSKRHALGRLFNSMVRLALLPGVEDTQAGLKGLTREATLSIVPRLRMDRFAFDVELLYAASRLGLRVGEVPVRFHYAGNESSLQLARDGSRMLLDLLQLKRLAYGGAYERPDTSEGRLLEAEPALEPTERAD